LEKRAVRNYLSVKIKVALSKLSESSLHYAYVNSLSCTKVLVQVKDELKTIYCGSRWCPVCGAIRTAKMIEGYLPVIEKEFKQPRFVVVSVPSPFGWELRDTVKEMNKGVRRITDNLRKTYKVKIKAVKKIEVTYNKETGTYHPHLSFLIEGKVPAHQFIKLWLKEFPEASVMGQYNEKANKNSIKELFKYTVKLVADSDIEVKALDVIFCSLFGMRTIQPIGIKKIVPDENEVMNDLQSQKIEIAPDSARWEWNQEKSDWFNMATGIALTGCEEYKRNKGPDIGPAVSSEGNIHIVGRDIKVRTAAFEADKKQTFRKIDGLNNSQIFDYPNENLEIDVLYQVDQEISKS
jgi:hypothetical protein